MKRATFLAALSLILALLLAVAGCDKERIVESTEYVEQIEYITLPPDTVFRTDTVHQVDTVVSHDSVTIEVTDTIVQVEYVHDTVVQTEYIYDTVQTVEYFYDTLYFFDTAYVFDTVVVDQSSDNEHVAMGGLQYHCNSLVIDLIYSEFGYNDGWILYLSTMQTDIQRVSAGVYDVYGYIDYWTPDWSAYYPLEYYWRISYMGGDPADPTSWQISEPPVGSPTHEPGLKLVTQASDRGLR